jgi:uncharacterized membrane protein YjjP (DUF1212 family)
MQAFPATIHMRVGIVRLTKRKSSGFMKVEELVDVALRSGEILLKSGAEIYRVEDTIIRIMETEGYSCDCFVLLSAIFLSVRVQGSSNLTIIKRVKSNAVNLGRIELINSFSRMMQHKRVDYTYARDALDKIDRTDNYKFITKLTAAAGIAFAYTLLFKGTPKEAAASIIVCSTAYIIKALLSRTGFFSFIEYFIAGIVIGFTSLSMVSIFDGMNAYKLIIGGSMFLLPGMAITNSIKDTLHGDTLSSMYRLAEAVLVITAVVIGISIVFSVGLK